ncbi:MAG: hypothetical protein WKG00_10080 [Polyangiaceae bacterium]
MMRLLRLPRGLGVDVVAEWPRTGIFDRYALTSGDGGSLVVSAWGNGHGIAVIGQGPDGLLLEAFEVGQEPLAMPAFKSEHGVYFARGNGQTAYPAEALPSATSPGQPLPASLIGSLF